MLNLVYFLLALGVIVLVHELGHLVMAKRNGVFCHEFSIGMGPKLATVYTDASGMPYNIRMIPLGGYVMMAGEDSGNEKDEDVPKDQRLNNKSAWARIKILAAGSFMNFILAITIFIGIGFFTGVPSSEAKVNVMENSPAAKAGITNGTIIKKVNDTKVNTFNEVYEAIDGDKDKKIGLTIQNPDTNKISVVELTRDTQGKVGLETGKDQYKFLNSIGYGFSMTFALLLSMFAMLKDLFTSVVGVQDLSGPVGIYQMSGKVLDFGFVAALTWVAYLSLNIGLMNLLPIPALDGGRLLFVFIELIIRRPINKKIENGFIIASAIFLLGLFVVVTFGDVMRIFK